jgi:hypothetical protein
MATPTRRFMSIARLLPAALLMLALATPAMAQLGGLKKKIKAAAGAESADKDQAARAGGQPAGDAGGTVVLDDKVVNQFIAGLKAGQAEREAAKKEDTPYGRYNRDKAAYKAAQDKCKAAQTDWGRRAAADEKLLDRYNAYTERMMKAQQAGENDRMQAISDSMAAMIDPSCTAKEPHQPDTYYEEERKIEDRAAQRQSQESGLNQRDMAMVMEKTWAVLQNQNGPVETSASEKAAVKNRSAELKQLLGIAEEPPAKAKKAEAPAPAPKRDSVPGMTAEQSKTSNCMAGNAQKHQKEIEALAQRAQAAQEANDMASVMAIADSIRQLQMKGCQ